MTKLITRLGIPYMGSKRRLSHEIITFIQKRHPEANEFYDIFGGGAAMSLVALQLPQFKKVLYNELNTQVVELLRYLQNLPKDKSLYKLGNILPDQCYEWVSRETFFKNNSRQDWYGGLISCIWSFGNNGKNYLFGKEVEETKRLAHMVVVYKDLKALNSLNTQGINIGNKILNLSTIYARRLYIRECVTRDKKVNDLQRLEQLQQLERLQRLEQLQQLERLQQLHQLQQLQQLQQLELTNLSYEDFDLKQ